MVNYFLEVISLEHCPYSIEVENLIKQNNINAQIIKVSPQNKHKYKNSQIQTFPQIYLKNDSSQGRILLGGNSDFKDILKLKGKSFELQKKELKTKYKNLSNKMILRLIQLYI